MLLYYNGVFLRTVFLDTYVVLYNNTIGIFWSIPFIQLETHTHTRTHARAVFTHIYIYLLHNIRLWEWNKAIQ